MDNWPAIAHGRPADALTTPWSVRANETPLDRHRALAGCGRRAKAPRRARLRSAHAFLAWQLLGAPFDQCSIASPGIQTRIVALRRQRSEVRIPSGAPAK